MCLLLVKFLHNINLKGADAPFFYSRGLSPKAGPAPARDYIPIPPLPGTRLENPEPRTPNPESRIPNPESRIPNPEQKKPEPGRGIYPVRVKIPNWDLYAAQRPGRNQVQQFAASRLMLMISHVFNFRIPTCPTIQALITL